MEHTNNRIREKIELIYQYDNDMNKYIKELTKSIIEEHRMEIEKWNMKKIHQNNLEHYNILV